MAEPETADDELGRSGESNANATELAIVAAVGVVVAVVMSWPLVLHLGTTVPHDLGDPLVEAWRIAWSGYAVIHQPLHQFQANIFWPLPDSLAFSEAFVGYAPAGLAAQGGAHAAIVTYDVLFLFSYALAFFGAYVLARELGLRAPAALVTGAAFAYAPTRFAHDGQLNVISTGGVPLALALLLHGYRRGSPRAALAGWLVAAWQVTLGFTFGLQLAVLLPILAVVAMVTALPALRQRLDRRLVTATAIGVAVFCLVALLQARPYLRVVDAHPEAKRSLVDVFRFSPPVQGLLAAPAGNMIWGDVTSGLRAGLPFPDEQTLFPGLMIGVLATIGLFASAFARRLRVGLAIGTVGCVVLSLGVRSTSIGYVGAYRLLYDFVPGWDGVRTPGRLNLLTTLGLALLAGAGATAVIDRLRHRMGSDHRAARRGTVAAAALAALIVVEGRGPLALPRVPGVPAGERSAVAPLLDLPSDNVHDYRYVYWTTAGLKPIANGIGSFEPVELTRLRRAVRGFPDAASVRALRKAGIRSVALHPGLAAGTPWAGAERRPLAGLRLTRTRVGDVVIYRLTG